MKGNSPTWRDYAAGSHSTIGQSNRPRARALGKYFGDAPWAAVAALVALGLVIGAMLGLGV